MTNTADAVARLKAASLRKTRPRIRILEALFRAELPLTIEEIHAASPAARCDLVTVYRCLEKFEEAGIARRLFRADGTVLYAARTDTQPLFIFDKDTNHALPLDERDIGRIRELAQRVCDSLVAQGYRDVSPVIQFFVSPARPKEADERDHERKPRKPRAALRRMFRPPPTLAELRRELESSASLYPAPCTEEQFLDKVSAAFASPGTLESLSALGSLHMWGFLIRDRMALGRQQRLLTEIRHSLAASALSGKDPDTDAPAAR